MQRQLERWEKLEKERARLDTIVKDHQQKKAVAKLKLEQKLQEEVRVPETLTSKLRSTVSSQNALETTSTLHSSQLMPAEPSKKAAEKHLTPPAEKQEGLMPRKAIDPPAGTQSTSFRVGPLPENTKDDDKPNSELAQKKEVASTPEERYKL